MKYLFLLRKSKSFQSTKRRGTQISPSKTAQPNYINQSFPQQCFLPSLYQLLRWVPRWAVAEKTLGELSACFSLTLLRNVALKLLHEYQCICSRLMRFSISVLPHWKHLGNGCHWLSEKPEGNGKKQRQLCELFNWATDSLILLLTSAQKSQKSEGFIPKQQHGWHESSLSPCPD